MSRPAVELEQALAEWFDRCDIAALSTFDAFPPLWVDDSACVFWHWEEHDREQTIDPAERGRLLRRVHDALEACPWELPRWEWPTRMLTAIEALKSGGLLEAGDASMLRQLLKRTVQWFLDSAPTGTLTPIYGDFNPSNVIWSPTRGWVLIDYDHVCVGAHEWDLTGCIHGYSDEQADVFAAGYGEDVRVSSRFAPTSWLLFVGYFIWRLRGEHDAPELLTADKEADAAILDWLNTDAQTLIANGAPMLSWADFVAAAHARMPSQGGSAPAHR
jgi:Ser/Thr protein kinase RdoA (MazF antagonist)